MLEVLAPLHPKLVHFPVALFIMALVFELSGLCFKSRSLHTTAVCVYIAGTLMAPLAVQSGLWEAEKINLNHPILTRHKQFAYALMWTSLASLPVLWYIHTNFRFYFRPVFIVLLIIAAILVVFTGDLGGRMVFEYGVGID